MKPYTDVFKKPLDKNEVAACARLVVQMKYASTSLLTRRLKIGYGKALEIVLMFVDAGVCSPVSREAKHSILLKNESAAVNAALRQLKKGKK